MGGASCAPHEAETPNVPQTSPWHGPRSTRAARTDAPARGKFAGARPPQLGTRAARRNAEAAAAPGAGMAAPGRQRLAPELWGNCT